MSRWLGHREPKGWVLAAAWWCHTEEVCLKDLLLELSDVPSISLELPFQWWSLFGHGPDNSQPALNDLPPIPWRDFLVHSPAWSVREKVLFFMHPSSMRLASQMRPSLFWTPDPYLLSYWACVTLRREGPGTSAVVVLFAVIPVSQYPVCSRMPHLASVPSVWPLLVWHMGKSQQYGGWNRESKVRRRCMELRERERCPISWQKQSSLGG